MSISLVHVIWNKTCQHLSSRVSDTDVSKDLVKVVWRKTIPGPLRKECYSDDDPHSLQVPWCGEQWFVANVGTDYNKLRKSIQKWLDKRNAHRFGHIQ